MFYHFLSAILNTDKCKKKKKKKKEKNLTLGGKSSQPHKMPSSSEVFVLPEAAAVNQGEKLQQSVWEKYIESLSV